MRFVVRIVLAAVMLLGLAAGPVVAGVPVSEADLSITKSGTPDPVLPAGLLSYTITVQNAGPDDALNVSWDDTLPPGTTFSSLSGSGGWTLTMPPVGGTGTVTGTRATLTVADGPQVFTLVVVVDGAATIGTVISNVANVTATSSDPNPINNSFITLVTVGVPATPVPSVPNAAMSEPVGTNPAIPLGIAALLVTGLAALAVVSGRRSSA